MIKILLPILLGLGWAWFMYRMSVSRLSADLDKNSRPIDDPELEVLVRRMGRQVEIEHLQAHMYQMDAINGLAAPDGRIFITTGLFDRYKRGEVTAGEVASVIAHELGHVARGHHKRRMIDWTGQNAARMALGMVLSRVIPFIGFYIANILSSLLMAKLSRRDEFEADEYASALMISSGLGVGPQISLFQKLGKLSPTGQGVAWLMSHPPTKDRIAAIEAVTDVPLVIHGGSGVPVAQRQKLARNSAICKFNIGTELRLAFGAAMREAVNRDPDRFDRVTILKETIDPVETAARNVIRALSSRAGS